MECITHEACLPGQAGEARYLTISSDASARYLRHDIVDAAMQTLWRHGPHGADLPEIAKYKADRKAASLIAARDDLRFSRHRCGNSRRRRGSTRRAGDTLSYPLPEIAIMPLTTQQRSHLENRLRDERARALELLNRIVDDRSGSSEQEAAGDLTLMPFHQADLGTDTMDQELDESNATRVSRELTEIDAALERLYKSPEQFGICEDTGGEIPFERLDMIPWARTCD